MSSRLLDDPLLFQQMCWPDIRLYDKQVEILYSVRDNDETIVPAGNALGKDFVSALCVLWFFCSRSPCRVVTSSVDQPQLKGVLWGEIRRFIQTSRYKLPIQVNDLLVRQVLPNGELEPLSYLIGRVTAKGEGMLGHHVARGSDGLPRTLALFDEASGIDDVSYEATDTWAHRKLVIGNPYPCTNFFKKGVQQGDLKNARGSNYYRKVIKIRAEDSPNVRVNLLREEQGKRPTKEIHVPGVVDYDTYLKRRQLWDKIRQSIGLDAEFYEGAENLLFPPDRLDRAERYARMGRRQGERYMGVDVAEGGDDTCWSIIDDLGLLKLRAEKTSDTSVIPGITQGLMNEWGIPPGNVMFDRGGGGKEHADLMRARGLKVKTVGFGEGASDPKRFKRMRTSQQKEEGQETWNTYKNRRAEMYVLAAQLLDPEFHDGFGIPEEYTELRRQLAVMPKLYDGEGKLYLPPKDRKAGSRTTEPTLKEMLGCSPDHADSFVLAVWAREAKSMYFVAG